MKYILLNTIFFFVCVTRVFPAVAGVVLNDKMQGTIDCEFFKGHPPEVSKCISNTKNFTMNYFIREAKAVCWTSCRHIDCDKIRYEIFYDETTFEIMKSAKLKGMTWKLEPSRNCSNKTIAQVVEQMESLKIHEPVKAEKIVQDLGAPVRILFYTNINSEVKNFLDEILYRLVQ